MANFGKIFWINAFTFGLYGISALLFFAWPDSLFLSRTLALTTFLVVFPLSGINIVSIIEKLTRQKFDEWERITLVSIAALLIPPLFVSLQYAFLGFLLPELPLINTLLLFLIAILWCPFSWEQFSWKRLVQEPVFKSFALAFGCYALLILFLVTAYPSLPDSDPYYWFVKLETEFGHGMVTPLHLHRPLFSSLGYIFQATTQIDFYAFFKYILPFFGLLVLFPAALVARNFPDRSQQLLIFFFPLANAAFILYLFMPIPQALFNTALCFFVFFLLYSWLTRKNIFYFLAGSVMLITYFYHEVALLFLLPWALITFITYHQRIASLVRHQWIAFVLLGVLILSHPKVFAPFFTFFSNWAKHILRSLPSWHTNFTFPLHFVNIDGRVTGWGSFQGVVQYYAFYMGPACLLAGLLLILYLRNKEQGAKLWQEVRDRKEFWVLALVAAFFFVVAEVLPRLIGIALLPERAWSTAAFIIIAFTIILVHATPNKYKFATALLFAAIALNVTAALYVNTLKKYLVTEEQLAAANWMKTFLPEEKVIFASGNWSLLKVHGNIEAQDIANPEFYQDQSIFEAHLASLSPRKQSVGIQEKEHLNVIIQNLRELEEIEKTTNDPIIKDALLSLQEQNKKLQALLAKEDTPPSASLPVYIFYSKPSSKNPYASRPYFQAPEESQLVFDIHPDRFQRIYQSADESVVIWQLIK